MIMLRYKCSIFSSFLRRRPFVSEQNKVKVMQSRDISWLLYWKPAQQSFRFDPSEVEEPNDSFRKENNKSNSNNKRQHTTKTNKQNKGKPEQFSPPLSQYFFSFSRPLRVSQLPRSWKKRSLTRHANLLVNICCGLQRIHKSDR